MAYEGIIVRDPKVMLGKPIIKGTNISVEQIVRKIAEGSSIQDLVKTHPPLTELHVKAALEHAAEMASNLTESGAIEYIKIQWNDIHHSRRQEWTFLGSVGGILFAMLQIEDYSLQAIISFIGAIVAILGAIMAWLHRLIFLDKIKVISQLDSMFGIEYPKRKRIPVQFIIIYLFALIAVFFISIGIYLLQKVGAFYLSSGAMAGLVAGLILLPAFILYLLNKSQKS